MRRIEHRYDDPLSLVWIEAASKIGLRIVRSAEAYASTDGRGTLTIGSDPTLDADDSLAQMIFHELCHSLVQGPESFEQPDWGLDNESDRDQWREHACLRTQAVLGWRYGLRDVFAPTTEHRAFYDELGPDPLAGDDRSVRAARIAIHRADRPPWAPHLADALTKSAAIGAAIGAVGDPRSLWARLAPVAARHPAGPYVHPDPSLAARTCAECAWCEDRPKHARCRATHERVRRDWPACEHFEASVECHDCGACCREAYEVVEVEPRDPFVRRHPELLRRADGRYELHRVDGRCPVLRGDGSASDPYACRHYDDRPRTCRDFGRASASCYDARVKVGRSS